MSSINVAIIGAGNCASSLVQGVYKYQEAPEDEFIPGLMHSVLGGYHISDINFVAAFDIDKNKVGKDLSQAIFEPPNNTMKFADVPFMGVPVERGMTHDGLGQVPVTDYCQSPRLHRRHCKYPQGEGDRRGDKLPSRG